MSYLSKPSTYVIGAVAIGLYLFAWPMISNLVMPKKSSS